jgi:hypothetical protein
MGQEVQVIQVIYVDQVDQKDQEFQMAKKDHEGWVVRLIK